MRYCVSLCRLAGFNGYPRRTWGLLSVLAISLFLTIGSAVAAGYDENPNIVHLHILAVNDFHGALAESGNNPGAARLAEFLKEAEASDPEGTILISAGDMFQGSSDSNLLYGKPVVDMMNYMQFDAMTLGNHEFDWGLGVLKQRMNQSQFPYVCANVLDKATGKPVDFVKPYIVLERQGLKIAVIGIATPETAYKTNPKAVSGYSFEDPAKVVNALVPELKQKGVDVIVVLAHLASWMDESGNISGDAAALVQAVNGIDAVVSGHSHQTVYGKVNGVPMVQANYNGRAVGQIELFFDRSMHQVRQSVASVTRLPYPGLIADPGMQAMLDKVQAEIAPIKNIIVGRTIHALSHDRSEPVETLLGQWVTDVMRQATGADIAFQNSGGLRAGISAGAITMGNLYEVMPFDNTLFTVDLTGNQIMRVLEHGIMNDKIGMVQYSGIKVSYNAAKPQETRIVSVLMPDGSPLRPEQTYKVVTNDFMAAGGDGFTMFLEGQNRHDTCIPVRDILADTIRRQRVIDFPGDDRWNLTTFREHQKDAA